MRALTLRFEAIDRCSYRGFMGAVRAIRKTAVTVRAAETGHFGQAFSLM